MENKEQQGGEGEAAAAQLLPASPLHPSSSFPLFYVPRQHPLYCSPACSPALLSKRPRAKSQDFMYSFPSSSSSSAASTEELQEGQREKEKEQITQEQDEQRRKIETATKRASSTRTPQELTAAVGRPRGGSSCGAHSHHRQHKKNEESVARGTTITCPAVNSRAEATTTTPSPPKTKGHMHGSVISEKLRQKWEIPPGVQPIRVFSASYLKPRPSRGKLYIFPEAICFSSYTHRTTVCIPFSRVTGIRQKHRPRLKIYTSAGLTHKFGGLIHKQRTEDLLRLVWDMSRGDKGLNIELLRTSDQYIEEQAAARYDQNLADSDDSSDEQEENDDAHEDEDEENEINVVPQGAEEDAGENDDDLVPTDEDGEKQPNNTVEKERLYSSVELRKRRSTSMHEILHVSSPPSLPSKDRRTHNKLGSQILKEKKKKKKKEIKRSKEVEKAIKKEKKGKKEIEKEVHFYQARPEEVNLNALSLSPSADNPLTKDYGDMPSIQDDPSSTSSYFEKGGEGLPPEDGAPPDATAQVAAPLSYIWHFFFGTGCPDHLFQVMQEAGSSGISLEDWIERDYCGGTFMERKMRYTKPVKMVKGGQCDVLQTQRVARTNKDTILVSTENEMPSAPYGDSFTVRAFWKMTGVNNNHTLLELWVWANWHKAPPRLLKGTVEKGAKKGTINSFQSLVDATQKKIEQDCNSEKICSGGASSHNQSASHPSDTPLRKGSTASTTGNVGVSTATPKEGSSLRHYLEGWLQDRYSLSGYTLLAGFCLILFLLLMCFYYHASAGWLMIENTGLRGRVAALEAILVGREGIGAAGDTPLSQYPQ
ncbi:JmjC domain-containing protein [Balamuthia mandrillaris]